jgi:hypothetical protein
VPARFEKEKSRNPIQSLKMVKNQKNNENTGRQDENDSLVIAGFSRAEVKK